MLGLLPDVLSIIQGKQALDKEGIPVRVGELCNRLAVGVVDLDCRRH